MVVVPVCLDERCCSSGCVDIASYNKDEGDESKPLPPLAFRRDALNAIFQKRQIILEPSRNSKYPIRCCNDDTMHYQVQSDEKQDRCKVCKMNSRRRYVKCKAT